MKVLTLWQPWASLVQLGVKTIETRSWSTSYRGPLAIHAAARKPEVEMMEDGLHGDAEWGQWYETAAEDYFPPAPPPAERWSLALAPDYDPVPLPLGAIVATCTLVDVVPILDCGEDPNPGKPGWVAHVAETRPLQSGALWHWLGRSEHENPSTGRPTWRYKDISDQRPYGDFTPGRFAWLLADVVPVDPPVPFKGGQCLTKTWEPAEVAA